MTKQRIQKLTDIMARVLHYQDSGEPDWATMDYAATKREYDELQRPIIDRYMNDAKFHAQVQRAVAMVLDLDRAAADPLQPRDPYRPRNTADMPVTGKLVQCPYCGAMDVVG